MEEVYVRFVLVFVLTHQQQHGGVPCLIQDCLTQVDGGEREVLQLLLQEQHEGLMRAQLFPPSACSLNARLAVA